MNRVKFFWTAALVAVLGFFIFASAQQRESFTDTRDGKTYRYVTIGNQTWMAENLNFATPEGSWCYDNEESNCDIYGRLYDWNTAQIVCPDGWQLPNNDDWRELENTASGAGRKLRAQSGWSGNANSTDDFGFSALPGGRRSPDGTFWNVGEWGFW